MVSFEMVVNGMRTSSSLLSFRTWASGQFRPCAGPASRRPCRCGRSPARASPRSGSPSLSGARNCTTICSPSSTRMLSRAATPLNPSAALDKRRSVHVEIVRAWFPKPNHGGFFKKSFSSCVYTSSSSNTRTLPCMRVFSLLLGEFSLFLSSIYSYGSVFISLR